MAEVASNIADINFITSDNPRNESPGKIIKEISRYMEGHYRIEIDRHKAIQKALIAKLSPSNFSPLIPKNKSFF